MSRGRRLGPVLLPLAFFLAVTLSSLDFGYHWDEGHGQLTPLRRSLERGSLLPGYYIYPGLNYWLNLSALTPDLVAAWRSGEAIRPALVRAADSPELLLRARGLRVVLVSLALVWVYLLALALDRHPWEAFLAASFLGLSWEMTYHSRWLAPDALMTQFGMLAMLGAVLTVRRPRERVWPYLGTMGAALACGTKYPGGLFLVFVLLALALRDGGPPDPAWRHEAAPGRWARVLGHPAVRTVAVFAAVYLVTTPGTLLEARHFLRDIRLVMRLYDTSSVTYAAYTVDAGLGHLERLLRYLGTVVLSPYPTVALALAAGALAGGYRLARRTPRAALLLLGFPAVYAAYFTSKKLMIARNCLALTPFVALLAALGLGALWRRLPWTWARGTLVLAVAAVLGGNAVWQVDAARSIRQRHDTDAIARELGRYLAERPATRFLLSARTAALLREHGQALPPHAVEDAARGGADAVVVHLYELGDQFPANLMPGSTTWFGPREVNLDLYTTWRGDDRPLVLPMRRALALPLFMPQVIRRRIAFPAAGTQREALVLAGDAAAGDQLYVEYDAAGTVRLGLDQWGGDAYRRVQADLPVPIRKLPEPPFKAVDASIPIEPGRTYSLAVSWDVLRGRIEARLDGQVVFARQADLVEARLHCFRVGAGAAVPGRPGGGFSGELS